jgi:7-carboxy-7-deazaguanine synthase
MSVGEIVREVLRHPARHTVLTGGEPMIAKGVHELATALKEEGKHVTIETAGTVPPGGVACDLASLSPKLGNSTPPEDQFGVDWVEKHERRRFQPENLREWLRNYECQVKFVVSSPGDLAEIDEFLQIASGEDVSPWKIQLMPEGTDTNTLNSRRDWILKVCLERGFRFCQRLQIELFGNTRGT